MKPCRVCSQPYEPTRHQIASHDYICTPCRRENDRRWRLRRKAAGQPVKPTRMPREYHERYNATYYQRADVKVRRAEQARQRRQDPNEADKLKARLAVKRAVKSGRLCKEACFCGSSRVDAHHDDYARPLDVKWLCRRHHTDLHHAKAEGAK